MRIGIISDLHGDRRSVEKALETLTRRRVDRIVCAGDLVEKGPDGDGVVALVRESLIPSVMGNHDHNAVRHASYAALDPAHGTRETPLAKDTLDHLQSLPPLIDQVWEGQRVVIAHGIPGCWSTYVFEDRFPKKLKRRLRSFEADVLILGHTHKPMCVDHSSGLRIVNPGSVCQLRTRDSHTCGILELPSRRFKVIEL